MNFVLDVRVLRVICTHFNIKPSLFSLLWQRGKYLMVRCPSDKEYGQWKLALESQTADNVKATYVRPLLSCPPHSQKVCVVMVVNVKQIHLAIKKMIIFSPYRFICFFVFPHVIFMFVCVFFIWKKIKIFMIVSVS